MTVLRLLLLKVLTPHMAHKVSKCRRKAWHLCFLYFRSDSCFTLHIGMLVTEGVSVCLKTDDTSLSHHPSLKAQR
jgi:hypothetical protein